MTTTVDETTNDQRMRVDGEFIISRRETLTSPRQPTDDGKRCPSWCAGEHARIPGSSVAHMGTLAGVTTCVGWKLAVGLENATTRDGTDVVHVSLVDPSGDAWRMTADEARRLAVILLEQAQAAG